MQHAALVNATRKLPDTPCHVLLSYDLILAYTKRALKDSEEPLQRPHNIHTSHTAAPGKLAAVLPSM
eukprot:364808-Chlamydomonas_euryale.AAC.14